MKYDVSHEEDCFTKQEQNDENNYFWFLGENYYKDDWVWSEKTNV
jgi:hypothetical protein